MKKAFIGEVVSNETSFVEEKINEHKSRIKVIAKMVLKEPDGDEHIFHKNSGVSYLKKAGDQMLIIKNESGSVYFHDSDQDYIIETKKRKFSDRFHVNWIGGMYLTSIVSIILSLVFFYKTPAYLVLGSLLPVLTLLVISLVYTSKKTDEYSVDEEGRKIILDYINAEKNEDGSVKISEVEEDLLVEKEEYLMTR